MMHNAKHGSGLVQLIHIPLTHYQRDDIMSKQINLTQIANACGAALGDLKKLETQAGLLKETMNKYIVELHTAKAKVGTYKKDGTGCALATAFVDGGISAGLTQSTMQKTYLPTFKKAVESGKPVTDWNGQRAKAKGKGKKASEPKSLANKLATCYRDEDFAGFIADLQASYDDAQCDNLIDGIKSYLEAEGIKLGDEE
jgi:hypothetical protein